MFHEFDRAGDYINIARMNAITGAVVCALTALLGIFMFAIAVKKIRDKKIREKQRGSKSDQ